MIYEPALARNSGETILAFWSKTDMDSINENFCLVPDVKLVRPKNAANDPKINLPPFSRF